MVKVGKIKPSIHLTDLHEKHQLWTQILNTTGSLSGVHDVISFIASFFFFKLHINEKTDILENYHDRVYDKDASTYYTIQVHL